MILYHGSKSGIKGKIKPISRKACDFSSGFYLGDKPEQPKGLIAAYPNHVFYEMEYDATGLNIKQFENDYMSQIDWALFIAYNREPEKMSKYEKLCQRYKNYNEYYDIIIGVIADDKMTQVMNMFFAGTMCDKAFIEALQYIKLGNQYVLKTELACDERRMKIRNKYKLTDDELKLIYLQNTNRKNQLNNLINQIQTKYRRVQDVKFFDEILEEWNE